ncbi:hypothetical protein DRO02_01005 [archaeon]|nr:MAG: hypothetical protein DRO02_01005 [archaeon]
MMKSLIVEEAEAFLLTVKYLEPFTTFHGTVHERSNLVVKLKLDNGVCGIGEATPQKMLGETVDSISEQVKEAFKNLLGLDCSSYANWIDVLPQFGSVSAAVDIAIHDAVSKSSKAPLYKFLGGSFDKIETDVTVGIPDRRRAEAAAKKFIREGFRKLKIKVGIAPLSDEIRKVNEIWSMLSEYGDAVIRLDANEGYSIEKLRRLLENIRADIEFIEQPLPRSMLKEYYKLRKFTDIPVMLDENIKSPNDVVDAWKAEACDYINVKVSRVGGLYKAIKIADTAERLGIQCMIGCTGETCLGITSFINIALSAKNIVFHDLDSDILTGTFHRETLEPPYRLPLQCPGHGISINDLHGKLTPIAKIQIT